MRPWYFFRRPRRSPENSMNNRTVRHLLSPFEEFARGESAGGITLIGAAVLAFLWANSPWAAGYFALREIEVGVGIGGWSLEKPLLLWINDGLMALFFFLVGREIKRRVAVGQLRIPGMPPWRWSRLWAGWSSPPRSTWPSTGAARGLAAGACPWRPT